MTAQPLVTFVMPVYNAASTLRAAVGSVLAQTITDIELIAVFDPSTDGTDEVLAELARCDERIQILRNTGKKQLWSALNVGLAAARGKFIARMDADDVALPDRLQQQMDFLSNNPDVAICGTAAEIIATDGRILGHFRPVQGAKRVAIAAEYAPPLFHPTWLMRREVVNILGGYREMAYSEDYDFQLRALDAGLLLDNCPAVGIRYRRNPQHRARTISHKAGNYAYYMHKLRQSGKPDGFDPAELQRVLAPATAQSIEKYGLKLLESGFRLADNRNFLGSIIIGTGLLLLPASARLTWRKIISAIRLWLHDWRTRS